MCQLGNQKNDIKTIADDRFKLIASFDIIVPDGYDHIYEIRRIDSFRDINSYKEGEETDQEKYGKPHYYDRSKNFGKVVAELVSRRKLRAKIFQVDKIASLEDCLGFLKSQEAILAGAPGIFLADIDCYIEKPLPKDYVLVCFDERDTLWKGSHGFHMVPYIMDNGVRMLYLDSELPLEEQLYKPFFILCLCEK